MTRDITNVPGGYVLIARKILDSGLMEKPHLYLKLWVWMLCKAFWRDGGKLKRGQFHTTTAEMQEAMSYRIGYRKITPTKDEVRSAYEAFTKATMITTTKATRGMVITVCNYDLYQSSESYEAHNEAHNEAPPNPAGKIKKEKQLKDKPFSSSGDEAPAETGDFFLSKKKRKLSGKRLESFNDFWKAFDYKAGKAEAADAWLDIPALTDSLVSRIVEAARHEATRRTDLRAAGRTPKMAQGWISGRRWEDDSSTPTETAAAPGSVAQILTTSSMSNEESKKLKEVMANYGC